MHGIPDSDNIEIDPAQRTPLLQTIHSCFVCHGKRSLSYPKYTPLVKYLQTVDFPHHHVALGAF